MTQNLYVCTIYFRPEEVYDVISGQNVKTTEGYLGVNFELATFHSFRDIQKNHFVTAAEAADIDDTIKRKRFRVLLKNKNAVVRDESPTKGQITLNCEVCQFWSPIWGLGSLGHRIRW